MGTVWVSLDGSMHMGTVWVCSALVRQQASWRHGSIASKARRSAVRLHLALRVPAP